MRSVLIVYKQEDEKANAIQHGISALLQKHGWDTNSCEIEQLLPIHEYATNILLVLGGDGTVLSMANKIIEHPIPILSINTGNLGFFTSLSIASWESKLITLLEECVIEDVPLLEVESNGSTAHAMNEVAVTRSGIARNIAICVHIGTELVYDYKGDGVIVATPYGSSAYARSAGGSLLHPALPALIITPILPSNTLLTPVVIPSTSSITIALSGHDITITCDGQRTIPATQTIRIQQSAITLPFIALHKYSYFTHVRKKKIV